MGRYRKRKGNRPSEVNKSRGATGRRGDGYYLTVKENEQFETYYKQQGIVPDDEFSKFIQTLRDPLPSTFRVTGFGRTGKELLKNIESDYLSKLCNITIHDKEIEPPKCLQWYPARLAWQVNTDRNSIRHVPELVEMKKFLVTESDAGNISRQEAVSMIPPLVLDVKPHHTVLDMCAAPGSKTSQLIEFLHAGEGATVPSGVVVANDNDNKRCYLMCHQVKRLQSPSFMVINHDAAQLPGFRSNNNTLIKFDRVLADVPCTGDGTLRKNVDAWKKWNPAAAHNLHRLQCRILKRGLNVLKSGGRLVYSTCSFNPIENEAVLSSVLSEYSGEAELIDVTDELPGLKFAPGKSMWKVMSRSSEWFTQMSDVPERLHTQIYPSMFPPTPEEAEKLHLERSIRILPHLQDTGGFFVAVILKKDDGKNKRSNGESVKVENKKDDESVDDNSATKQQSEQDAEPSSEREGKLEKRKLTDFDNPLPLKHQKLQGYKEDPFIFLKKDDTIMDTIVAFYGLSSTFPTQQIMVRNSEGRKRNLYFVSNTVKETAQSNEDRVKFINMGVKLFSRSESKYCTQCDYRLCQDGIEVLFPFMQKRIIHVSRDDLIVLLNVENPFLTQLTKEVQEQMKNLDSAGSIVYVYDPTKFETIEKPQCKLIITGWKGVVSARTFLPVAERVHYLRLFGVEYRNKDDKKEKKNPSDEAKKTDNKEDAADENQKIESEPTDETMDQTETENGTEVAPTDDRTEVTQTDRDDLMLTEN